MGCLQRSAFCNAVNFKGTKLSKSRTLHGSNSAKYRGEPVDLGCKLNEGFRILNSNQNNTGGGGTACLGEVQNGYNISLENIEGIDNLPGLERMGE
jgi:hypothetical protein